MLTFYGHDTKGAITIAPDTLQLPASVSWIDVFQPSADEMAALKTMLGVRVPTLDDLVEIETSSRLTTDGDALVMSLPATVKDEIGYPKVTPIGFVVTKDRVATIRFEHLPSFENLSHELCGKGELSAGGMGATVTILEMIVDHIADLLERVGGDLDAMSRSIFSTGLITEKSRRPHHANEALKHLLQKVGRSGDLISKVSESLLGISRIAPFLLSKGGESVTPDLKNRLDTIGQDVRSLHDYQDHIANKTQFLLDTLLGLANIEQNNVFRVLTVVSVVGIPPTFFASMYGMNFKGMPEYDWAHGYAYGLTLIVCSALLPALWFKIKGWW
jgi:magnesium transporter